MTKITTTPDNALKFAEWLRTRGGILQWKSGDLSDPGWSVFTPAYQEHEDEDGNFPSPEPNYPKPSWKAGRYLWVCDPEEVQIVTPVEVKRFHVAVQRGYGLSFVLTGASSKRLRAAVEKAGEDAWYEFDYGDYNNAVIYVPGESLPLDEWLKKYAPDYPLQTLKAVHA